MSHFVRLTGETGQPVLINLDRVERVRRISDGDLTELEASGGSYYVREDLDAIEQAASHGPLYDIWTAIVEAGGVR